MSFLAGDLAAALGCSVDLACEVDLLPLTLEGCWPPTVYAIWCVVQRFIAKMRDVLLAAFHSSWGAAVVILNMSMALWNEGPGLLGLYFDKHLPEIC